MKETVVRRKFQMSLDFVDYKKKNKNKNKFRVSHKMGSRSDFINAQFNNPSHLSIVRTCKKNLAPNYGNQKCLQPNQKCHRFYSCGHLC